MLSLTFALGTNFAQGHFCDRGHFFLQGETFAGRHFCTSGKLCLVILLHERNFSTRDYIFTTPFCKFLISKTKT